MQCVNDLLKKLILFRPRSGLLAGMGFERDNEGECLRQILEQAVDCGWQGNLWHCVLAQVLAESENPFSLACERRPAVRDSLWDVALEDMKVFQELFGLSLPPGFERARHFIHNAPDAPRKEAGRRVQVLAEQLNAAADPEQMLVLLTNFYRDHGVGILGLGDLFRVQQRDGATALLPVEGRRRVVLDDLVGYDSQKKLLLDNTLAFLGGRRANNALLYGDAGTGKSTSVQALACEYACQGLRVIELYKQQFALIPDLLGRIKSRHYRFILLLDDLSFEENEVEYKHLKAVMEGGGEAAPENVLIYATSNRRHLIKETWSDRSDMQHDGDIHRSDTVEEKLSLSGRFGLQIYFPNPSFEEYHTIVRTLAQRAGVQGSMTDEALRAAAAAWQVRRGNRSGRTAQQFVSDLQCKAPEEDP